MAGALRKKLRGFHLSASEGHWPPHSFNKQSFDS
jgi:hypothetical protein